MFHCTEVVTILYFVTYFVFWTAAATQPPQMEQRGDTFVLMDDEDDDDPTPDSDDDIIVITETKAAQPAGPSFFERMLSVKDGVVGSVTNGVRHVSDSVSHGFRELSPKVDLQMLKAYNIALPQGGMARLTLQFDAQHTVVWEERLTVRLPEGEIVLEPAAVNLV